MPLTLKRDRASDLRPRAQSRLSQFYQSLFRSEVLHCQDYLTLAKHLSAQVLKTRIHFLANLNFTQAFQHDPNNRIHRSIHTAESLLI